MKYLSFLAFIFLLLTSCSNESKQIYITGRVLNPVTGQGINCGIKLYQEKSGKKYSIESVRTDSDGYFFIAKNTLRKRNLVLTYEDAGVLYPVGWTTNDGATYSDKTNFKDININGKTSVNLHMIDKRTFYYKFVNVNCGGPTDSLIYSMKRYYYDDYLYYNELKKGCGSKSGNNYIYEGPVIIDYTVKRNGTSTSYSVTVPNNNNASNPAVIEY